MILQKLEIKNFRNIKEFTLDLSANSNGSEYDLEKGNFVNGLPGTVISKVVGLIGPNAVGKTNILSSLNFFGYIVSGWINIDSAKKVIYDSKEDKTSTTNEELIKEARELLTNIKNNNSTPTQVQEFLDSKSQQIESVYKKEASDSSKPIEINITMFNTVTKTTEKKFVLLTNKTVRFSQGDFFKSNQISLTAHHLSEAFSGSQNKPFEIKRDVHHALLEELGNKKFLKLINIADPEIVSIFKKGNKVLFGTETSEFDLDFDNLSSGTKCFLYLMHQILIYKNEKYGIVVIDEIELNLHRELALAVIKAIDMIVVDNELTFIFTTHNPMIFGENVSYKQVFEISFDSTTKKHSSTRLSSLFKSHENIENKYKKGIISPFPSKTYVYDSIYEVINE